MNEKLEQFLGMGLKAISLTGGVLLLAFDTDGDPNTETVATLTVIGVAEDDIRCD